MHQKRKFKLFVSLITLNDETQVFQKKIIWNSCTTWEPWSSMTFFFRHTHSSQEFCFPPSKGSYLSLQVHRHNLWISLQSPPHLSYTWFSQRCKKFCSRTLSCLASSTNWGNLLRTIYIALELLASAPQGKPHINPTSIWPSTEHYRLLHWQKRGDRNGNKGRKPSLNM